MPDNTANMQEQTPQGGAADKEFQPISTQAELDRIIGERIARERAKYAGYAEFKAKAAKFDEMEQAGKSELEKANDRAAKAEEELKAMKAQIERSSWNTTVADSLGMPVQVVADLSATSLEDLTTKASRMAELLKIKPGRERRSA